MNNKDNTTTGLIVILSVIFIVLLLGVGALSIAYKNSESNSVIIYYQGFDTPYIEYRLDKGSWYPKVALEKNNDVANFTHKIVVPVENGKGIVAKFSDGKGNVLDNGGRCYTFEKGTWLFFENGAMVRIEDADKFGIVKFAVEPNGTSVSTGTEVKLSVSTLGGKAPYSYKFVAKDATGAETVIQDYNNTNVATWKPTNAGNYMLIAIAKDGEGTEVTQNIEAFNVVALDIKDIKTSVESPQKVGENISLSMDIENSGNLDIKCYFEIKNDDETKKLEASSDGEATWTPEKEGEYEIIGHVESGESKISKTIKFTIEEDDKEELVIYYHSNEPQDINYAIASEGGTYGELEMIGDTMQRDNSKGGYDYKYTISLASDEVAVVYFLNNQNGEVDDNDGQYYVLRPGIYGVKRKQVFNLADDTSNNNGNINNNGNLNNNGNSNNNHSNDNDEDNSNAVTWDSFFGRNNN